MAADDNGTPAEAGGATTQPPSTTPPTGGDTNPEVVAGEAMVPQSKVNELVGQTRTEARQRALAEWAKERGFDDPAAVEQLIKAQREADEAQKSELEKERAAREKAEQQAQQATAEADALKRRVALTGLLGAHDPPVPGDRIDDALALYPTDGELTKEAIAAWLKSRPYLAASPTAPPSTRGADGRGGDPAPKSDARLSRWGFQTAEK